MRPSLPCRFRVSHLRRFSGSFNRAATRPPLISIQDGTFYRRHPSPNPTAAEQESNKPLLPHLNFLLPADEEADEHWCVIGPSNAGKTTFLQLLQGRHLCFPPTARTYPYLSTDELLAKDHRLSWPARAIQYVGFDEKRRGLSGMGTYLSARFESRKEETDFKVDDYLRGRTQLNSSDEYQEAIDEGALAQVVEDLRLSDLLPMPVSSLSNGQTRRAQIAKAILGKPELLLLDEPFMGLDPPTIVQFNPLLRKLAYTSKPRLLLALRPQDPIPDWITHAIYLDSGLKMSFKGEVDKMTSSLESGLLEHREALLEKKVAGSWSRYEAMPRLNPEIGRILLDEGIANNPDKLTGRQQDYFRAALRRYRSDVRSPSVLANLGVGGSPSRQDTSSALRSRLGPPPPLGETLLQMDGVTITYGDKPALGDWQEQLDMRTIASRGNVLVKERGSPQQGLRWSVKRGQRWAVIGPNGSGKTSLLSLITSDHPLAYSAPMKIFGRSRLPQPGIPGLSLFEIQSRIGHSSPEIHSFFPRNVSVRRTLESAWAETPLSKPKLDLLADRRVDACLRWFQEELNPALGPYERLHKEALFDSAKNTLDVEPNLQANPMQRARNLDRFWYEFAEIEQEAVEWADDMKFGEMTFSGQRVALFIRAIIAQPDIVILDEALSGMDDVIRDKCLLFLEHGESRMISPYLRDQGRAAVRRFLDKERKLLREGDAMMTIREGLTAQQALIVVSHVPLEIPRSVRDWVYLPTSGAGLPAIFGQANEVELRSDKQTWDAIWTSSGLPILEREEYETALSEEQHQQVGQPDADPAEESADTGSPISLVTSRAAQLTIKLRYLKGRVTLLVDRLEGNRQTTFQTRLRRSNEQRALARKLLGRYTHRYERMAYWRRLDRDKDLATVVAQMGMLSSDILGSVSALRVRMHDSFANLDPSYLRPRDRPFAKRDALLKRIGSFAPLFRAAERHRFKIHYARKRLRKVQAALPGEQPDPPRPHMKPGQAAPASYMDFVKRYRAIRRVVFYTARELEFMQARDLGVDWWEDLQIPISV